MKFVAKKTDFTDEFLNEFKKVEQLIQQIYGSDKTFRDIEIMLDEKGNTETSKKMQICRNIRNYVSHNPDSHTVIPVPEETVLYLQKLYISFSSSIEKVKDRMSRVKALSKSDILSYASQRLGLYPIVPVVDDDGMLIGAFSYDTLRKAVADSITPKTKLSKDTIKLSSISNKECIEQTKSMEDAKKIFIEEGLSTLYVTNDGTTKGKYIGMVVNEYV